MTLCPEALESLGIENLMALERQGLQAPVASPQQNSYPQRQQEAEAQGQSCFWAAGLL